LASCSRRVQSTGSITTGYQHRLEEKIMTGSGLIRTIAGLSTVIVLLAGCAGKTQFRSACASEIKNGWSELDIA